MKRFALVVFTLALLAGCGGGKGSSTSSLSPQITQTPAPSQHNAADANPAPTPGCDVEYGVANCNVYLNQPYDWNQTIGNDDGGHGPPWIGTPPTCRNIVFDPTGDANVSIQAVPQPIPATGLCGTVTAPFVWRITGHNLVGLDLAAGVTYYTITIDNGSGRWHWNNGFIVNVWPTPQPVEVDVAYDQNLHSVDMGDTSAYAFDQPYGDDTVAEGDGLSTNRGTASDIRKSMSVLDSILPCDWKTEADTSAQGQMRINATGSCTKPVIITSASFTIERFDPNNRDNPVETYPEEASTCPGTSSCTTSAFSVPVVPNTLAVYRVISKIDVQVPGLAFFRMDRCCNTQELAYNNKTQPYPVVYPNGWIGNVSRATDGKPDKVPFPGGRFEYCPSALRGKAGDPCIVGDTKTIRTGAIAWYAQQGYSVPTGVSATSGGGYDTHHIKPSACGGGNEGSNGVFLDRTTHNKFSRWWDNFPLCATSGTGGLGSIEQLAPFE